MGQDPRTLQFSSVELFWVPVTALGQVQFSPQFPPQFMPQFPLQLPFTWHGPLSPARGQEMPGQFKIRANPARSRTSATIGYLFIICPQIWSLPLPYEANRLCFFYLYFIVQSFKSKQTQLFIVVGQFVCHSRWKNDQVSRRIFNIGHAHCHYAFY